jgi:hypothetical protein
MRIYEKYLTEDNISDQSRLFQFKAVLDDKWVSGNIKGLKKWLDDFHMLCNNNNFRDAELVSKNISKKVKELEEYAYSRRTMGSKK